MRGWDWSIDFLIKPTPSLSTLLKTLLSHHSAAAVTPLRCRVDCSITAAAAAAAAAALLLRLTAQRLLEPAGRTRSSFHTTFACHTPKTTKTTNSIRLALRKASRRTPSSLWLIGNPSFSILTFRRQKNEPKSGSFTEGQKIKNAWIFLFQEIETIKQETCQGEKK